METVHEECRRCLELDAELEAAWDQVAKGQSEVQFGKDLVQALTKKLDARRQEVHLLRAKILRRAA